MIEARDLINTLISEEVFKTPKGIEVYKNPTISDLRDIRNIPVSHIRGFISVLNREDWAIALGGATHIDIAMASRIQGPRIDFAVHFFKKVGASIYKSINHHYEDTGSPAILNQVMTNKQFKVVNYIINNRSPFRQHELDYGY